MVRQKQGGTKKRGKQGKRKRKPPINNVTAESFVSRSHLMVNTSKLNRPPGKKKGKNAGDDLTHIAAVFGVSQDQVAKGEAPVPVAGGVGKK